MQSIPIILLELSAPPLACWLFLKWKMKRKEGKHSILALQIILTLCVVYSLLLAYSLNGEPENENIVSPAMAIAIYPWSMLIALPIGYKILELALKIITHLKPSKKEPNQSGDGQ